MCYGDLRIVGSLTKSFDVRNGHFLLHLLLSGFPASAHIDVRLAFFLPFSTLTYLWLCSFPFPLSLIFGFVPFYPHTHFCLASPPSFLHTHFGLAFPLNAHLPSQLPLPLHMLTSAWLPSSQGLSGRNQGHRPAALPAPLFRGAPDSVSAWACRCGRLSTRGPVKYIRVN